MMCLVTLNVRKNEDIVLGVRMVSQSTEEVHEVMMASQVTERLHEVNHSNEVEQDTTSLVSAETNGPYGMTMS
jgi:hypothetical protein